MNGDEPRSWFPNVVADPQPLAFETNCSGAIVSAPSFLVRYPDSTPKLAYTSREKEMLVNRFSSRFLWGALLLSTWDVSAQAIGPYEGYVLRSRVAEVMVSMVAVKMAMAESPEHQAACTIPAELGSDYSAARVDGVCRVSRRIGSSAYHLYLDVYPQPGDVVEFQCLSDLPPALLPESCERTGTGTPSYAAVEEEEYPPSEAAARIVVLAAAGELDDALATARGASEHDGVPLTRILAVQALAASRDIGDSVGYQEWLIAQQRTSRPDDEYLALVWDREIRHQRIDHALRSRRCDWLPEIMDETTPGLGAFAQQRLERYCEVCGEARALPVLLDDVDRWEIDADLNPMVYAEHHLLGATIAAGCLQPVSTDLVAALRSRIEGLGAAERLSHNQLMSRSYSGEALDPSVIRKALLQGLLEESLLSVGRFPVTTYDGSLGQMSLVKAIEVHARTLLSPPRRASDALGGLGRAWAEARLTAPSLIGDADEDPAPLRMMDVVVEASPWATYAPDLVAGIAGALRDRAAAHPQATHLANVLELVTATIRGEQAIVHSRVSELRPVLPSLFEQYQLPEEMLPAGLQALELVEAATAGRWQLVFDRVAEPLGRCGGERGAALERCVLGLQSTAWRDGCVPPDLRLERPDPLDETQQACLQGRLAILSPALQAGVPLRLLLADMALGLGLPDAAATLLRKAPAEHEAEAGTLPLLKAQHLGLIARLAMLEGDLKTAQAAQTQALAQFRNVADALQDLPEVRRSQDLQMLRLDVALGRNTEAHAALQRLRDQGAGLPRAVRVGYDEEIAVATHLLEPSAASAQTLDALQQQEIEVLHTAARGGDRGFIRTLLSLRAARRDRRLALALMPKHPLPLLAWQESAWFKGIAEQLAENGEPGSRFAPTVRAVQQRFGADTAVLDYAAFARLELPGQQPGHRHLLATVLRSEGPPVLVDLGPYAPVAQAIHQLRAAILARDSAALPTRTQHVHTLIWKPLQEALAGVKQVVVIPDADLHLLPFEWLRAQGAGDAGPSLYTAASLREALADPSATADVHGVAILAAPDYGPVLTAPTTEVAFPALPGALAEGRALARLWASDLHAVKIGADASEAALRDITRPRILHLATHGYVLGETRGSALPDSRGLKVVAAPAIPASPAAPVSGMSDTVVNVGQRVVSRLLTRYDDPLTRVGIALANANRGLNGRPDGTQDGIVDGREVIGLPLQGTELVVLSACDTGIGETLDGGGIGSLQRAFHQAGARYVLATLWPIDDDASAAFMKHFHTRLQAGDPPRAALAASRQHLQAQPGWDAPVFWAAFQISGPVSTGDPR